MRKTVFSLITVFLALLLSISGVSASGYSVSLDFSGDDYPVDLLVKEYNPFSDYFYVEQVGDEPNFAQSKFTELNGKKVMGIDGYFTALTYDAFDSVYFSANVCVGSSSAGAAIFFRASQPVIRNNPKNAGDARFTFYEWDWYAENDGKNNKNGSNMGNSGCGIMLSSDGKIILNFKTYETDGLRVGNYPLSFSDVGTTSDYYDISVRDVDNVATVYVNNVLIAKIEMSSPRVYTDDTADGAEYYSHAKVYGADGELIAEIDNTRLAVENRLAIAGRNRQWYVSGVTIRTGEKVDQETNEVTTSAETVPDTEGNSTTQDVHGTNTEEPGTSSISTDESDNNTKSRETLFLAVTLICSCIAVFSIAFTVITVIKRRGQ